jgi:hypothetical protein
MIATITTTQTDVEKIATRHMGQITASNEEGTVMRVVFPWYTRAAGFIDEMVSRFQDSSKVKWNPVSPRDVVVCL